MRQHLSMGILAGFVVALAGCSASSPKPPRSTAPSATRGVNSAPSVPDGAPTTAAPTTASSSPMASVPVSMPVTSAPIDGSIKAYGNCRTPTVEPSQIVLTCADYNEVLEHLHWASWTSTSATATGTLVYNDCIPSCAEGHFHNVPGTSVTLTVPVRDDTGQLLWSKIQEDPQPPGYATGPYHGGPQSLPLGPI